MMLSPDVGRLQIAVARSPIAPSSFDGKLGFLISLLPYTGNSEWVEPTLLELKACLMHDEAPSASAGCEFCGYIAATHKVENGRVATPPPPRHPISNRHPADQIADVRQQIAVLKKQETDLREMLINATELNRVGDDWIAKVSEQKRRLLDREALENHFGADTLQPFMRESAATVLKLMDRHTRTRPFPGTGREPALAGDLGSRFEAVLWIARTGAPWQWRRDHQACPAALARAFADRTSISGGIDFAIAQLERAPFESARRTIDVSGDGTNNAGRDVTIASARRCSAPGRSRRAR